MKLLTFFIIITLFISCQKTSDSPVIARVGKSTLTLSDFKECIPPEYTSLITEEENINYVRQWIDAELFYQEALRQKIDKEKDIKKRLIKMKKDLLSAELLNRISLNTSSLQIENNLIHQYYEKNKDTFKREKNIAKYIEIFVSDSKVAWYITKNANSENILTLAAEYSQNPVPENMNIPFVPIENIPVEIRSTIQSMQNGTISIPIKTDIGYHVLYLIEKLDKGGICSEDEVKDDIIYILSNNIQKERINNFLSELRLKTNIEFNNDVIKNYLKQDPSSP